MANKFRAAQTANSNKAHLRAFTLCFIGVLICLFLQYPTFAYATDDCSLSKEDKAAYIADGTYDQRVAFQEELNNASTNEGLIQRAKAREESALSNDLQRSRIPRNWQSGMDSTGDAHVLVLYVSFPDQAFSEGDTLDALSALFNGDKTGVSTYPYENLHNYYNRASYGKLNIQATAFAYTATNERSYYSNDVLTLFDEAIKALQANGQLDLNDYDKNNDGKIDAVYLHFAGEDTGWGSTWWSNERIAGDSYQYDGKTLWNVVTLHNKSNNEAAARTVIHETGHVLGLPDYYSYKQPSVSSNSGMLTSDMMMDNRGDHNAFSKWLLGWIDSDNIIRVVANSSSTKVKKGNAKIEEYPADTTVSETLSSFDAQDISSCGGFIAVSNDETLLENEGLFSSFYLLQYDTYAQNQSVTYSYNNGLQTLSSGFRTYRIQGALNQAGTDFAKNNAYGSVYDQFIELVDPDSITESGEPNIHSRADEYSVLSSNKSTAENWACMYYEGMELTPTTYPSTNFFESINSGFTGLNLSFTKSNLSEGTVEITYSEKDQPDIPDFSIAADKNTEVYPQTTLSFTASTPVTVEPSLGSFAFFYVDGKENIVELSIDDKTHTKITFSVRLDSVSLNAESKCSVVFPEGLFLYAKTASQKYVSPRIELELPVGSLVKSASNSGTSYEGATQYIEKKNVSSFFIDAQNTPAFIQRSDAKLLLHTLKQNDYSSIEETHELGLNLASNWDYTTLKALPLDNGLLCVIAKEIDTNNTAIAQHYLWFNPDNNYQLIAQKTIAKDADLGNPSALLLYDVNKIFSLGSTVVTSYYPGGKPGIIVGGFDVDPNSSSSASVTEHWIKLDAGSLSLVSNNTEKALAINHHSDSGSNIDLVRASSLHSVLNRGAKTFVAALDTQSCDSLLDTLNTLSVNDYYTCNDVTFYKNRYFVLASSPTYLKPDLSNSILLRYNPDNPQEPEKACALTAEANNTAIYQSLVINSEGIISASYVTKQTDEYFRNNNWSNEAIFFDCNLSPAITKTDNQDSDNASTTKAPHFINFSDAYGIWKNNAFCLPGWLVDNIGPAGSYDDTETELLTRDITTTVHYLATSSFENIRPDWIIEPDPKPDPDVPAPDPDDPNPDNSDNPTSSNSIYAKSHSAQTADTTSTFITILAILAISSSLILLRASTQIVTKKK